MQITVAFVSGNIKDIGIICRSKACTWVASNALINQPRLYCFSLLNDLAHGSPIRSHSTFLFWYCPAVTDVINLSSLPEPPRWETSCIDTYKSRPPTRIAVSKQVRLAPDAAFRCWLAYIFRFDQLFYTVGSNSCTPFLFRSLLSHCFPLTIRILPFLWKTMLQNSNSFLNLCNKF